MTAIDDGAACGSSGVGHLLPFTDHVDLSQGELELSRHSKRNRTMSTRPARKTLGNDCRSMFV